MKSIGYRLALLLLLCLAAGCWSGDDDDAPLQTDDDDDDTDDGDHLVDDDADDDTSDDDTAGDDDGVDDDTTDDDADDDTADDDADCWTLCDLVGNVSEFVADDWQNECYGEDEKMIAGGAAHQPANGRNGQHEDPENPDCWLFDQYAMDRTGVHHHTPDPGYGYSDDGFRCALDPATPGDCPDGMAYVPAATVTVAFAGERWGLDGEYGVTYEDQAIDGFCVDVYEASQPDATDVSPGYWRPFEIPPAATSREGVIPWTAISQDQARQACEAAGKRLLWFAEWQLAFSGPSVHNWPWGDDFEPAQGCQVDQTSGAYPTGACCPTVCGD